MFIIKIRMNIVRIIGACLLLVFFRVNKTSLKRKERILFLVRIIVGDVFQGFEVETIRIRGMVIQVKDKIEEDGSNTENRFVII
jgi:hypothetical protein